MRQDIMISIGLGLVVGLTAGFFLGRNSESQAAPVTAAATMPPAQMPPQMPGQAPSMPPPGSKVDAQGKIAVLLEATSRNPKDPRAWFALGNEYFDTHQPQLAIEAYDKGLAMEPNPDVLTDQGVMYRELHQHDKALACFEKAQKLNPQHLQSLYNMGVVYGDDLKKPDKAFKAWERVISLDPNGPMGTAARQAMERLKARKP
ncbi:MAG: tetratricopeptide repeat protein [Acidobacteria bacterium]|nr:tetratricopeptide repeat protein [Acidobacteriota bacterium]